MKSPLEVGSESSPSISNLAKVPGEAIGGDREAESVTRLSVIVPCYNEALHLEQLLDALRDQDFSDFEVIVVDGNSTDGTPELVGRYACAHPEFRLLLISNPHRIIPVGLNLGIRQSRGEIIVRLDGHSRPAHDYLRRCWAALFETGAQVVGGVWNIRAGASGVIARAIACAVSSWLGAGDALYRLSSILDKPGEVDTVPFGCFHRRTWERLGGYNEALHSNEDYEFNLRVRLRGGRVYFDPRIRCDYFARASFPALARQYARYGWWKAQMLKRYPGSLRWRQMIPLAWSASSLGVFGLAVFWPLFQPVAILVWLAYFAVVIFYAGWLAVRQNWALWPALVLAFGIIHFSWGWATWSGLALSWLKPVERG